MYIRVHSWATSLQANSLLYGTTDVLVAVEQCTSVYTVQRRVCGANSLLLNFTDIPVRSEKPFTISFFANSLSGSVHPCTLPDASFCAAKTSLLIRTPDIRVRSETTRREQKLTAGTPKNEHPCSFLGYKFAGANLLLLGTTAIHGGFDTLRIFRSGTDAARIKQKQV